MVIWQSGGHASAAALRLGQVYIVCAFILSGCSWFGSDEVLPERGPSLAEVIQQLPSVEFEQAILSAPDREQVILAYQRVYGDIPDAQENHSVGKRLAALEMEVGENRDILGEADPYQAAIELYVSLLDDGTVGQLDLVLYQLARAYDLSGESDLTLRYIDRLISEYPASTYAVEAHFRRAEINFSEERYRAAAADYQYVIRNGERSRYASNSLYMLGWSQFKISELDAALASFFLLLEQVLGQEELAPQNKEILDDTLRVVVQALAYLDGAETLALHMQLRNRPAWQYLVYKRLAQDYRDKERYLDSVATLQTFINHNALDARSPVLHQLMIETLIEADFPSEVLPKKREFVLGYGARSEFWKVHETRVREAYSEALENYIAEIAQTAHASAQESELEKDYLLAADWYEQFIETFPAHSEVANYLFLSGEAYTDAHRPVRAVVAYQRVVREFPENENAAEAGYAAVVAFGEIMQGDLLTDSDTDWQRAKIDAQIEFAILFPNDVRAAGVQADAADTLFTLGEYPQAIELASHLLNAGDLDSQLRSNALLILGHGYFELTQYAEAESAYRTLKAETDKDVDEQILASIYKQAEVAELNDDLAGAITHYLRTHDEAPGSELAVKGLHDAIVLYETQQSWDLASQQLERFRELYPAHEYAKDIPKRLTAIFEKSGRWLDAADELLLMVKTDPDSEVQRLSKYRAAELFLLAENRALAIEHFRDYAHEYMQPADVRLEAMQHMDELYQLGNEPDKRRFWLNKKIQLHAALAADTDAAFMARATTLAAEAQYVFAVDHRIAFTRVEIKHPLKKYLKRKQKALVKSVASFEKLAAYKVEGFSTAATYEIAELYTALSTSLLESERPRGLSPLELEQYEILLEEQAFPFEEQAIELHVINQHRAWEGTYDEWVKHSFTSLALLMPGRYSKAEQRVAYVDQLF